MEQTPINQGERVFDMKPVMYSPYPYPCSVTGCGCQAYLDQDTNYCQRCYHGWPTHEYLKAIPYARAEPRGVAGA